LAGVLDRPPRGDRTAPERRPAVYYREGSAAVVRRDQAQPAASIPGPQLLPAPPPRSKWPWLVVWGAAVLVLVILGLRYYVLTPPVDPLALMLVEHNGQLQIEWNHSAHSVVSAVRGTLSIRDGEAPRTVPLTPQDLERGSFTYQRASDDVEVRMSVENARGDKVEETTTFLGAAPVQPDSGEKAKAEKERGDLQAEIDRLRSQNAGQAARIQELERTLTILQARLGAQ
jgi:hypothetical protein